jgi:hypothetical protein
MVPSWHGARRGFRGSKSTTNLTFGAHPIDHPGFPAVISSRANASITGGSTLG